MNTREHWLQPLLAPSSIALVGGSPREGSVGNLMIRSLVAGGYRGTLTVVNPKYTAVDRLPAVPSIRDLPQVPDLAVLSVASHRMETIVREAIRAGVRSFVIFDACFLEGDREPRLLERLKGMASEAGVPVCGGNGLGYYNYDAQTFVSFQDPVDTAPGHITALCHSGSVFGILANEVGRWRFNLLTSQGQEINASVADYMDYALEQSATRVLVLFIEAVRDPERFIAALEKAGRQRIPVIVTKVGRTPESARLAETHSGAMAGNDDAFDALCQRYGVLRTDDLDSLMAAAQIFALGKEIGDGDFAAVLDSGGLRGQLMDLARDLGLAFTPLADDTVHALTACLDIGLEAVNPLDAAGRFNEHHASVISTCATILEQDPGVSVVAHEYYRTDRCAGLPEIEKAARKIGQSSKKPYILTYSLGAADNREFAGEMLDSGVPVVNGVRPMLKGVKCVFDYRDFQKKQDVPPEDLDSDLVVRWMKRLCDGPAPGESEALRMLAEFGIDSTESRICTSFPEAVLAAEAIGYPVVAKTAVPGLVHKSDCGGVHLGIVDEEALRAACATLSRLGPEICVAEMVPDGVEVAFGMVNDPHYGPVVMVSAGGTLVELLDDRVHALAPFGCTEALRLLHKLKIRSLLDGYRSRKHLNGGAVAAMLSRFSVVCHQLRGVIAEMDINPVIVTDDRARAVDAVLIPCS